MKKIFLFTLFFFSLTVICSAQSLVSMNPSTGAAGTQLTATITAQNTQFMVGSPQGAYGIYLRTSACYLVSGTNMTPIDDTHLSAQFNIPAGLANGSYILSLTTFNGNQQLTLPAAFTVTGGTNYDLQTISPTTVVEGQMLSATITGQNLQTLIAVPGFSLKLEHSYNSTYSATNIAVVNANTITADFLVTGYADSGYYNLEIRTQNNGCFTLANSVYVQGRYPKQLVSIQPATGAAGNSLNALISGRNTMFMLGSPQGIQTIQLKDQHCNVINGTNATVVTDSTFTADFNIPANSTNGVYDVYVMTRTNHAYTLPVSFSITGGVTRDVTSFSPSSVNANTTLNATITGVGIDNILAATPVTVEIVSTGDYHIVATNINATSSQATLDFVVPIYADNGFYEFRITSAVGCYKVSNAVQVSGASPRGLLSITPNTGVRGQALTAAISSQYTFFMPGTPPGGIQDIMFKKHNNPNINYSFHSISDSVINNDSVRADIIIPFAAPAGLYDVIVRTVAGDIYSLAPGFEITGTRISGRVFLDVDSNGAFNAGDYYLNGRKVLLLPDSIVAFTNSLGEFNFAVDSGQYTVEYYPDTNAGVTTSPQQYVLNIDSIDVDSVDFGINMIVEEYNLYLTITPGRPRCGWYVYYDLNFINNSTTTTQGQVYFVTDTGLPYGQSIPPPDATSGDTLFWNYDSLNVFAHGLIKVSVQMPLLAGTQVHSKAGITAEDGSGNVLASTEDTTLQVVTCSIDPNDKSVEPPGVQWASYVLTNDYLEYLIRFQNTGTDTAFQVIVLDDLDAALDMTTFEVVASSHPVETHLYGHTAEFRFDNIMLPDSNVNEVASHGYVKYRIKPFANTPSGTPVDNKAGIYFDLNMPVITNTTHNTLVDQIPFNTIVGEIAGEKMLVFPNPSHDKVNIILPNGRDNKSVVRIFNSTGKLVKELTTASSQITVDVHSLPAGLYLLQVNSADGKGSWQGKIVIQ